MKYPNSSKDYAPALHSASNRGMSLEDDLNKTNAYYLNNDIAVIYKKPTPITIVKVDYPSRNKAKITEAYFKVPSTTDYNGIYKGKYIDFEAKECQSFTSFPFADIHAHQIKHLERVLAHGAICFIIMNFTRLDEVYLIRGDSFLDFYHNTTRKSLPYNWVKEKAYIIERKYNIPIDYLSIVDKIYDI